MLFRSPGLTRDPSPQSAAPTPTPSCQRRLVSSRAARAGLPDDCGQSPPPTRHPELDPGPISSVGSPHSPRYASAGWHPAAPHAPALPMMAAVTPTVIPGLTRDPAGPSARFLDSWRYSFSTAKRLKMRCLRTNWYKAESRRSAWPAQIDRCRPTSSRSPNRCLNYRSWRNPP